MCSLNDRGCRAARSEERKENAFHAAATWVRARPVLTAALALCVAGAAVGIAFGLRSLNIASERHA